MLLLTNPHVKGTAVPTEEILRLVKGTKNFSIGLTDTSETLKKRRNTVNCGPPNGNTFVAQMNILIQKALTVLPISGRGLLYTNNIGIYGLWILVCYTPINLGLRISF